jgi:hypothetical protein
MSLLSFKSLMLFSVALLCCLNFGYSQSNDKECKDIKVESEKKDSEINRNNGEIKLKFEQGDKNYEIFWSSYDFSAKGAHIKNLKPGFYSVIIADKDKCITRVDNIKIEEKIN